MKTNQQVIDDLFGSQQVLFTHEQTLMLMEIYSKQFKYIKTTDGKDIIFDDEDYDALRKQLLFFDNRRNCVMCVWKSVNDKKTAAPVAKLLLNIVGKSVIHYKDKNPLNLKKSNIEVIEKRVGQFKSKKQEATTSKYKGVSWNKFAGKWAASIKVEYIKKHLGYFAVEEDAAKAYNDAAIEHFGKEYSLLNIIE